MLPEHHAVWFQDTAPERSQALIDALSLDHEVIRMKADTFLVGDARQAIEVAARRPLRHDRIAIVIEASAMSSDAQQMLLKVLEEPPATARFVLMVPPTARLLPTVLSRLFVVPGTDQVSHVYSDAFATFMGAELGKRLELVADWAKTAKDKDPELWSRLAADLDAYVRQEAVLPVSRSRVLACRLWLTMNGAARKMVWEELALTLPPSVRLG